jgi:hypothetical protein
MTDWNAPTLASLRHDFENRACWCTGACMVDGVQGPCPLVSKAATLAEYIDENIAMELDRPKIFGLPVNAERLQALEAAKAEASQ